MFDESDHLDTDAAADFVRENRLRTAFLNKTIDAEDVSGSRSGRASVVAGSDRGKELFD